MPSTPSHEPDACAVSASWRRKAASHVGTCVCLALLMLALVWPATTSTLVVPVASGQPPQRSGRVFYVAPWGRDYNRGTNPRHAWRTVTRVDKAKLRAGDTVLFDGRAKFSDNTLMPGWGLVVSGTAKAPITFGSWGRGRAVLTKGVWLGTNRVHPHGPSHLRFRNLRLGPTQGFQGTGDYITLERLKISHLVAPYSRTEIAIETQGSHWVIADNTIEDTGDSGMLLGFNANSPGDPPGGSDYVVAHNTITHTGVDRSLDHAAHGIYLKITDAWIEHNNVAYFADDGVSARYRDARIIGNHFGHGSIGIAWYQYDGTAGTSQFVSNLIANTSEAEIFVCGVSEGCVRPIESFVIERNRLHHAHGVQLNLQPTRGYYKVLNNP